jgi:hypothetical protein
MPPKGRTTVTSYGRTSRSDVVKRDAVISYIVEKMVSLIHETMHLRSRQYRWRRLLRCELKGA